MANACCSKGDCSKEFCKSAEPKAGEAADKTPETKQEKKGGHCTPKAGNGGCGCG